MNGHLIWIFVWRTWVSKLLVVQSWCIFIVLKHLYVPMFMLFSSIPLTMWKNYVLKQQLRSIMNLKSSYPRCDGCFRVGASTILAEIFKWINIYVHMAILKSFYCQPKKLKLNPNLYPISSWWEYFELSIFFSRPQWCPMFNGLWTSPWTLI